VADAYFHSIGYGVGIRPSEKRCSLCGFEQFFETRAYSLRFTALSGGGIRPLAVRLYYGVLSTASLDS